MSTILHLTGGELKRPKYDEKHTKQLKILKLGPHHKIENICPIIH